MRYFQEVELANFMPISEAAEWIAFGHLPMAEFDIGDDSKPIETRENIDQILDYMGHHVGRSEFLSNHLLSQLFPEVDADQYIECLDRCSERSPQEIVRQIKSWREQVGNINLDDKSCIERKDIENHFKDYLIKLESDLESARQFQSIYVPVARKLSIARAKLFLKLVSGEIPSRGLPMPVDDSESVDWEKEEWPSSFEAVPPEKWRADTIDWKKSNLLAWDVRYLGVILATADVLTQFPAPDITAETVSGEIYGETIILKSDETAYATVEKIGPRRGAPRRTEKALDDAIYAHLDILNQTGKLPSKIEAQVAEISDFVQARLGQAISRSTAQRLRASWKEMHAQKDAQK